MDQECWEVDEKVNEQENAELEKPFTEVEIKEAIFSMEKNTAPGLDQFIKEDLLLLFQDFYNLKLDIGRFNYGTITLLPKVKDANNIKQYRPICLLNVIYKFY
jgi:hypothetical protein